TTTRPYQPTIILSGSGFTSVTQISWACTTGGSPCANSPYVWTPANWSTKFSVTSDSVASVAPVLVAPTDPPGTTQWSVTFTAGSQTVTKSFSVTYSPPVTAPTITGVSPSPVTGSSSQQTITIIGTNFVNKPTLTLTWTGQPNYTVPTAQVTFISSTQLQMAINTTTQADSWTVKVTNPDGQQSNVAGFQVVAPAGGAFSLIFPLNYQGWTADTAQIVTV